jgi:hypothetical protein
MENLLIEGIATKALSISFLPNWSQNNFIATFIRNLSPASTGFQILAIATRISCKYRLAATNHARPGYIASARIGQDLDCCLTRNIKATKTNSTHNSQICLVSDRRC